MKSNIIDHLTELRNRAIVITIVLIVFAGIGYTYHEHVMDLLLAPLQKALSAHNINRKLIFTNLTEAFTTKIRLSLFTSFLITIPFAFIQLYLFCAPGLFKKERFIAISYMTFSPILFFSGALLCYFYVMPMAWQFFLSFESTYSQGMIPLILEAKIADYLSLSTSIIIAFGLAFQLPLALLLFVQTGLVKIQTLQIYRRHALVVILVISAIITPPDIISQIVLSIPLYLLFEITILLSKKLFK